MNIEINGLVFDIKIERKQNKNMYMRVYLNKVILITAHPSVPVEQIQKFIESKREWVVKTYQKIVEKEKQNRKGTNGPIIYVLGEKKYVSYVISKRSQIVVSDDIVTFYVPEITDKEILKAFNKYAKALLTKIVEENRVKWDKVMLMYNVALPSIKVKTMRGKWGSCLVSKSEITMNLSLVHYPLECIDYVLWHEYVHLIVPNHSKRFYDLLSHHMPNYKKAKERLM